MTRHFGGSETVGAALAGTWEFVTDLGRLGPCLPGVTSLEVSAPSRARATVTVGAGPFRVPVTFDLSLDAQDATRSVRLAADGAAMGSRLVLAAVIDAVAAGEGTRLDWHAECDVTGPLASAPAAMLDAQIEGLLAGTLANVRHRLA